MNTFVRIAPAMLAVVLLSTASAATRQDDDAIARAIVIGQVYPSGDVIFGGFIDDDTRSWPPRVTVTPMFAKGERNPGVDFVRAWTLENPFAPPEIAANSSPSPEEDIFAGIDRFFDDRLVALYLARSPLKVSTAVIGWSDALDVTEVSFREQGKPRPATAGDLAQVARRKHRFQKTSNAPPNRRASMPQSSF